MINLSISLFLLYQTSSCRNQSNVFRKKTAMNYGRWFISVYNIVLPNVQVIKYFGLKTLLSKILHNVCHQKSKCKTIRNIARGNEVYNSEVSRTKHYSLTNTRSLSEAIASFYTSGLLRIQEFVLPFSIVMHILF